MKKTVLVLPGDGIGQEVCEATLPILTFLIYYRTLLW